MNESKPPTSSRIIQPSIVPAALGHSYASTAPFQLARPKLSQVTQSSVAATSVSPAIITLASQTSAGAAQFQVPVPLVGSNKETLTVVTSYACIPKSNCTGQRTAVHPSNISAEKQPLPVTLASAETFVKASVKNIGIQKVNVKQVAVTLPKPHLSGSPATNLVQGPVKKDCDHGKVMHFLASPGLRQPLKPYQHQVTGEIPQVAPRSTPAHSSSRAFNQQDNMKPSASSPSLARTKPPNAPHVFSKKHTMSQQPKTTISIAPGPHIIPSHETVHRVTTLPVTPLSTGNKSIYQVLTPTLQTVQGNSEIIKKLVSQAIALPVSNSPSSSIAFLPSSSALSSGQITVMTCGSGIAYVPVPASPNGTSNSIPIAKVYPQQQPTSRPSLVSTASGRLTVPVNASSTQRTTPSHIHVGVGPVKSTPATSIITTQTTIMSTIPIAGNKSVANSAIGSLLCWPTFSQPLPASTVTSVSNLRPSIPLSSSPGQQSIPGTIRVQSRPGNVLLVENPKSGHLHATGGTASVLQDARSSSSSSIVTHQPGVGPTTPTMSPKPAILRRPRPENSGALKKLSFPAPASSFATQRRDLHTKPNERRTVPYALTRPKISEDAKTNIPVFIQHGTGRGDKIEAKPVLENQVFAKQIGPGSSVRSLKLVNSIKSHPSFSNPAKDGGTQSYSIHPIADLKIKVESGFSAVQQNSVKSEPASASQMLQFQHQSNSMHTYAAESPNTILNVQHRVISQASGQHTTSHTMFTKPGSHSMYPSHRSSRPKPAHVIKAATLNNANPQSQSDFSIVHSSRGANSFPPHRTATFTPDRNPSLFDSVKMEQSRIKPLPGLIEQAKQPGEGTLLQNHELPNHLLSAISPAKCWPNVNSTDSLAGLSPRKRPRKQTHIISEVVMEDEESTDDADECEDEPMPEVANLHSNVSTTPTAKLPGHKSSASHRPINSERRTNKKSVKEENVYKSLRVKSEATSIDSKPCSDYTDRNGVRYVVSRKRPPVSVLNRLKPNSRSIANYFMHYSDVRVKDKKTTIIDLANDKGRLKGIKVARLALQMQDMVECEKDVRNRMQVIHDGLVSYKSTLVGDTTFDGILASPSPGTPSSLSNSFRKATPRSSRSSSMPATNESEPMQSPSTLLDHKAHKVKDEILNIEELAQANLQRCRVVSDQLADIKTMLLKSVDHRQLVTDILESSTNQKIQTQSNPQKTKRLSKKKNTS